MKFKIEANLPETKLQAGDVVTIHKDCYLIVTESKGFIARSFDGVTGSTGYHETIALLEASLKKFDSYKHYSKDKFELILKPSI